MAFDITLPKPFVFITPSDGVYGLIPMQNNTMRFGTVAYVYDTSDRVIVGQSVIFDTKYAYPFIYGSTVYYMVKDEFVTGQENAPP